MIKIKEYELSKNSFGFNDLDNIFITFLSCNNILTLIYSSKNNSIISYNLNEFQIINEIKNAHEGVPITNFRHFFDKKKKIDLILSISSKKSNIRIWNNSNWELILNLENIYSLGKINSACFLQSDINNIFIVTSNNYFFLSGSVGIFNLEGKMIKEIYDSKYNVYYIDTFINLNNSKIYIIACCYDYLISYDYDKNIIYNKYHSENSKFHYSFKIISDEKIIKLIESSMDGNIRIWDFNSSELLKKINISKNDLYSICILNKKEIFVGTGNNSIILLSIEKEEIIKNISGFNNWICCINIIEHKKLDKCIIFQGVKNEQIKLYQIKDIIESNI